MLVQHRSRDAEGLHEISCTRTLIPMQKPDSRAIDESAIHLNVTAASLTKQPPFRDPDCDLFYYLSAILRQTASTRHGAKPTVTVEAYMYLQASSSQFQRRDMDQVGFRSVMPIVGQERKEGYTRPIGSESPITPDDDDMPRRTLS